MKRNKLFGTDGIRGEFGKWPLTEDVIYAVSLAVSKWLKNKSKTVKRVIIGRDTRKSCLKIEQCLAQGFSKAGVKVLSAGVIPTPGLAYLTNTLDVQLGVMISASHNPWTDNGIKFFKHNGFKFSEKEERNIERIAFPLIKTTRRQKNKKIKLPKVLIKDYIQHLKNSVLNLNLLGKKIVTDCANGAVSTYAKDLFESLGAEVFVLNDKPDGMNINRNCGSLHPDGMASWVKKKNADIGFSFDGDGDRVIFSDETGRVLDGDFIMAIIAKYFLKRKCLGNRIVIATSMSNFGLEKFLKSIRVRLIRADVGDKYVLEGLIKHKANFGGEQSGHIIFLKYATTGDGLLTALKLLEVMQQENKKTSFLSKGLKKYPQLIRNVRVREKREFEKMPLVQSKINNARKQLNGKGRLVMRYSGTEPLARIMVEGKSKRKINMIAKVIAKAIKQTIGADA